MDNGWQHVYSLEPRLNLILFFFIGNFLRNFVYWNWQYVVLYVTFLSFSFALLPWLHIWSNRRAHSLLCTTIPLPCNFQWGYHFSRSHFFSWRKDEIQWHYNNPLSVNSCRRTRTTKAEKELTTNSDFLEKHFTNTSLALKTRQLLSSTLWVFVQSWIHPNRTDSRDSRDSRFRGWVIWAHLTLKCSVFPFLESQGVNLW